MSENGQKRATVTTRRLEERAPGYGAPAGWLPEVYYHLTAIEIPPKKEDFIILIQFKESFLLRRLAVKPEDAGNWFLRVFFGQNEVMKKTSALDLSEDRELMQWPPTLHPKIVPLHMQVRLFLTPKDPEKMSDRFECVFRGSTAKRL